MPSKKPTTKKIPVNSKTKKQPAAKKGKGKNKNPKPCKNTRAVAKAKETEKKINTETAGMRKLSEYLEFVSFIAQPSVYREKTMGVKTQAELAKKLGVDDATLSDWKKRPGFWEDVMEERRANTRERSGNVIAALEKKCIREGNGADVRVYLTYTGEYKERNETEHVIPREVAEALAKLDKMF